MWAAAVAAAAAPVSAATVVPARARRRRLRPRPGAAVALATVVKPAPASSVVAAVPRAVRPTFEPPRTTRTRSQWQLRVAMEGARRPLSEKGCPRLAAGEELGAAGAAGSPAAVGAAEAAAPAWLSP